MVWRVAPFAAVVLLGLGVLVVPEPDRGTAIASPAALAAAGPAGAAQVDESVSVAPVASPSPTVTTPQPAGESAPAVTTTTSVSNTTTTTTSTPVAAATPLSITEWGWSTASGAGTAAGTAGIPDGALPVGANPGGPDKVSWFRLSGGAAALVLQPISSSGANRFETDASIALCRSAVDDWATGANLDASETPPVDEDQCVDGKRADDGNWSFDLSPLGTVEDQRGVVLVPGTGLFQITFARLGET